ncbi:hypothetical protein MACK_001998 [Theileria orientalis]|uniref:RING-type domain-containing protein n=1 Tax=Theileria orientalis TaxID=68886 RepID=A0A976MBF6_THEOR|nr:hypothetical protein MACK_001998 [Theileria orientalis]
MGDNTLSGSSDQHIMHTGGVNDELDDADRTPEPIIDAPAENRPQSSSNGLKWKALKNKCRKKLRHKIKHRYSRLFRRHKSYIKHFVDLSLSKDKKLELVPKEAEKPTETARIETKTYKHYAPNALPRDEFYRRISIIRSCYNKLPIIKSKNSQPALNTVQSSDERYTPILIETPDGLDVKFNLSILIDILTCSLCKGLFYNAHTIKGCMHTFCKSCLVLSTIENGLVCPICFTVIHKDIAEGIEYDHNIQGLVDKIFPEFVEKERKEQLELEKFLGAKEGSELPETADHSQVPETRSSLKNELVNSTNEFLSQVVKQYDNIGMVLDKVLCLALVHESDNELKEAFKNIKTHFDEYGIKYPEIRENYPRKYICVPKTIYVSHLMRYLVQELSLDPDHSVVFMIKNAILSKNHTVEFICKSLKTYELSREIDSKVYKNDYSDLNDKYFVRFQGDDEDELKVMCKSNVDKGTSLIRVPLDMCYSLDSCISSLLEGIKSMNADCISVRHENVLHIKRLQELSIGVLTKRPSISTFFDNLYENRKEVESGSFETRLDEFINYKRLLVFRSLLLADHILSVDNILIKVLDNPYMKYYSINDNEKELFVLTFALASEYYLKMVSSVIRYMNDGNENEESDEEKVRVLWLHHLYNKDVSHIPMMFDIESVEQIQEPILQYKISQRRMVLKDMMGLFSDPVKVIRDRLELIAQSRSMMEDRSDGLYYSAKVDLKTNVEDLLEKMELELNENEMKHKLFSNSIFSISPTELSYILGENGMFDSQTKDKRDGMYYKISETGENIDGSNIGSDGNTGVDCDYEEKRLCVDFFNDFILNSPSAKNILNKSLESVILSLNSIVETSSMSRFFCTIVSHAIRPGEYEADVMETSYMADSAPGIQCKLEDSCVDWKGDINKCSSKAYIVPLIDLCNHGGSKANSQISLSMYNGKPSFVLSASSGMDPGDEILINYGHFDNNVCFLDYGFVSADEVNNHVLMEIEANTIKDVAKMHDTQMLLPSLFPEGIPKEKMDLIKSLDLVEINDKGDLGDVYENPYFEGLPVVKYMEFNQRFMSNKQVEDQSNMYYTSNCSQDRTRFVDRPISLGDKHYSHSKVNPLIRVDANGIPESRLIMFLKILLCKTKKKLDWMKIQSSEKLSRSINSPIDRKAFEMASSIALMQMNDNYSHSLFEDYKKALNNSINGLSRAYGIGANCGNIKAATTTTTKFKDLRKTGCRLVNSLVLAHSMRQKIPIYKCSAFYSRIAKEKTTIAVPILMLMVMLIN